MIVRQSTARTILVGPVLDSSGVAKTDEVVASIKVTKNGTVGGADGSATLIHDHAGKYKLSITANDCDTVGVLEISLNSGTNDMPVKAMNVIEEPIWDALFAAGATGLLPSNVTQISGDSVAADNAEAFFDGTGYAGTGNVIPTVTTLTNLPAITAGWLTATGIAADAITAAKIADGAIDTATFAVGTTIPRVTLVDTTTTNTDMRGTDGAMLSYTQPTGFLAATFPSDPADQSFIIDATNTILGRLPAALESGRIAAALSTARGTQIDNIENAAGYTLAVLSGACADPQTASETYAITVFGSTFTVDMTGQTSTGTRTAPTLTKA